MLARHAFFTLQSLDKALAHQEAVEDVMSDVFMMACHIIRTRPEKYPTTRSESLTWLRRITLFKCSELRRKRQRETRRRQRLAAEEAVLAEHAAVEMVDSEHDITLARAYEILSEMERRILDLYFKHRLTSRMIAEQVDMEAAAVRKMKQRAIQKIRRYLENYNI